MNARNFPHLLVLVTMSWNLIPSLSLIYVDSEKFGARLCLQITDNLSTCAVESKSLKILLRQSYDNFQISIQAHERSSFNVRFKNGVIIREIRAFAMKEEAEVDIELMNTSTSYSIRCDAFRSFAKVSTSIIMSSDSVPKLKYFMAYPPVIIASTLVISNTELQSGHFTCCLVQEREVVETFRIFTHSSAQNDKSPFVSVPESTIQRDETGNGFIVPCRTNYRLKNPPPHLLWKSRSNGFTRLSAEEMKGFSWDPWVGFQFNGTERMWEMDVLACQFGYFTISFLPSTSRFAKSFVVKSEGALIGSGEGPRISSVSVLIAAKTIDHRAHHHKCNSYVECNLVLDSGMLLNKGRSINDGALTTQMAYPPRGFGIFSCLAGYIFAGNVVPEMSSKVFFIGLDKKIYLLPGTYPNSSVVQITQVDGPLYKGHTKLYHVFTCTALNFVRSQGIYFILRLKDKTEIVPEYDTKPHSSEQSSDFRFNVTLDKDMTHTMCLFSTTEGKLVSAESLLRIVDAFAPRIENATTNSRTFRVGELTDDLTLTCPITAGPTPIYRWIFDEKVVHLVKGVNTTNLTFLHVHESIAGTYTCQAWNQYGNSSFDFQVSVQPEVTVRPQATVLPQTTKRPQVTTQSQVTMQPQVTVQPQFNSSDTLSPTATGLIAFAAALCLLLACAVVVLACKYLTAKQQIRNLTPEEALEFLNGIPTSKGAYHGEGPELALQLAFTKPIESQSLVVARDKTLGRGEYGIVYRGTLYGEAVAVKTFKRAVTYDEFRAGLVEVKLMHFVGEHPNIVKFIGADVTNIEKREILVVMELSHIGSLEKHLRILKPSIQTNYVAQPSSQYANVDERSTQVTLFGFCEQIAFAMEYLESKKIIHGDLATRNVLVFCHNVVKVTDFGYSRQLYENSMYKPKKIRALPWRWASIELLRQMEFSTESDIWAFGVTIWEIFTFSNVPFASEKWTEQFMESLEKGLRLNKPPGLSEPQYSFLKECWQAEKSVRPRFSSLSAFFSKEKDNLRHCFETIEAQNELVTC